MVISLSHQDPLGGCTLEIYPESINQEWRTLGPPKPGKDSQGLVLLSTKWDGSCGKRLFNVDLHVLTETRGDPPKIVCDLLDAIRAQGRKLLID